MPKGTGTYGPAYEPIVDGERLNKQHVAIREYMLVAGRKSLAAIASALGYPEASISAQLRHLRKPKFGGYIVEKRKCGNYWEYRVLPPAPGGVAQESFLKELFK